MPTSEVELSKPRCRAWGKAPPGRAPPSTERVALCCFCHLFALSCSISKRLSPTANPGWRATESRPLWSAFLLVPPLDCRFDHLDYRIKCSGSKLRIGGGVPGRACEALPIRGFCRAPSYGMWILCKALGVVGNGDPNPLGGPYIWHDLEDEPAHKFLWTEKFQRQLAHQLGRDLRTILTDT